MGAVKDVTSAILPYAMLAGIAAVIYVKRDAIINWLKGTLVPDSLVTDSDGDNWNDAGTGVIDADKPLWDGPLICKQFPSLCNGGSVDTTIPGTTPGEISDSPAQTIVIPADDLCNWEPWKSSTACQSSREPITTPGYAEALAGVSNLVTGSAADAYANAQAIRAAAAAPPASGWNFQTIRPLIEADGYTEIPLSPTLALGINQYGWDVHYTKDSGPWHEGQIISMTSGGNNPFGGGAFDAYLQQALRYSGAV